jgi:DNA ligase (NAD+)
VRIQRAGDVIPQVVEVVPPEPDSAGRVPERGPSPSGCRTHCPNCGTPVEERGPFTLCPNRFGCSAQLKGRIVHFASRQGLDIEGLGDETASLLVDRGSWGSWPTSSTSRWRISFPSPLRREEGGEAGGGDPGAAAHRAPARFLFGLGIPEVGAAVARDLANHFRTLGALRGADREALEAVHGIGPRMSEAITAFFAEPANAAAVDRLEA